MRDLVDALAFVASELLSDADDLAEAETLETTARGPNGMEALLRLSRLIGEAGEPFETLDAARNLSTADAPSAVAALVIVCFASVRADFPSRQDASAARAAVSALAETTYGLIDDAAADVLYWSVGMVGATVRHLSSVAASRVPLVRVETGISLPSSLLAFDLYGDPARGAEIVARNRAATPMLMPAAIETLGA